MARIAKGFVAFVVLVLASSTAYAQEEGSITGTVKDTSGAVLPGVTVEAASPALIEKIRTVVTDGTGQYRIVNLRPGTYAVTFTLTGFSVVKREGIELTGAFIATVNADLKVGAVTETITVSGATPVVDIQNARKQAVLSKDVVDALPSGRTSNSVAALVPGVSLREFGQDVGGTTPIVYQSATIHGSYSADSRYQIDGFSTSNNENTDLSVFTPNMGSAQEVNVNVGAGGGEQATPGLIVNVIPKEGANTFSASFFGAGTTDTFQASNFTQRLKDEGVLSVNHVKNIWDVNPAVGGPIVRDRLWFYFAARSARSEIYTGGVYYNKFAGLKDVYKYEADLSRPATTYSYARDANIRATWQVTPKNKVNLYFEKQTQCACAVAGAGTVPSFQRLVAPEAAADSAYNWPIFTVTWSSPLTNRLLLEAGLFRKSQDESYSRVPSDGDPGLDLIPVTDTVTATPNTPAGTLIYHGRVQVLNSIYNVITGRAYQSRASLSYVSGAHAFKVGFDGRFNTSSQDNVRDNNFNLRYTFNQGNPVSLTEVAVPFHLVQSTTDTNVYVQDRWTIKRLTLNVGARYDRFHSWYPDHFFGPGLLTPARNFTIPGDDYFNYNDVTPKLAAAYDLFGTGKTAIKVTLNKHAASVRPIEGNPTSVVNNSSARSWNDANRNFVPDCNLTITAANGECGALPANFGQKVSTAAAVDPGAITGWGTRAYVWEFSAGAQHEIVPRVSADVTYFRRWNGNFLITQNRALSPSDYDPYSVTAPVDPKLPGGGGYVVSGLYDLKPSKIAGGIPTDNYRTLSDRFGNMIDHWNGVDITVNARPQAGILLSGGISTGRRSTDTCDVYTKAIINGAPAASTPGAFTAPNNPSPLYCHIDTNFLTQFKLYGTYTIPRVAVQVAGTLQSFPGPTIAANVPYTSAQVASSLGRPLSTATLVTVNVVPPGTQFVERVNQLDLRFGKLLTYGHARANVAVDLYNALNSDTVLIQTDSYFGPWQTPVLITQGRMAKLSVQFNF
jgi:hypothetical protein